MGPGRSGLPGLKLRTVMKTKDGQCQRACGRNLIGLEN
jgi:hypothetical protein